MIKQKDIAIKESAITITQFNPLEVIALRGEISSFIKKQLPDSENLNIKTAISLALSIVYEMPQELMLKLFKNCSCVEIGGLHIKENVNKAFQNNPDGILELVLEVLDFNGFFTLSTLEMILDKFPMLQPVKEMFQKMKADFKKI
jgi:hypothetical protein